MKYDDAAWHHGGDFPADLDHTAGATHIAMFAGWCVLNGLGGEIHTDDFAEERKRLHAREITPGRWFVMVCDDKFTDEDLNEEGNAVTAFYYAGEQPPYVNDYENTLGVDLASLYHVPDTWQSYDLLCPCISKRYQDWKHSKG